MKNGSLLETLLLCAIPKIWREVSPKKIIDAAQVDEALYAHWQFEFDDSGLMLKIWNGDLHPADKIVLTLLVVERGESGLDSNEFMAGLVETDIILEQIIWICSVQISQGQVESARAVTNGNDLNVIINEPDWLTCLDSVDYRRLVALCDALQQKAQAPIAHRG